MADSLKTKTISPSHGPARPRLALRIGITGARSLDARRLDDLREKLREVLDQARRDLLSLSKEKAVAAFYASGDRNQPAPPLLSLLSPLARGADRLAAEAALDLGYALHVPMPFTQQDYEKDFKGTDESKEPYAPRLTTTEDLDQFRALLARAGDAWLSLDGTRREQNRAYEGVGRFVVRHSDLLIAVWDGDREGGGLGGTAEIVAYAASAGVPVWWIHATEQCDPVWIDDIQDLHDPLPPTMTCVAALRSHLEKQIRLPAAAAHHRHGVYGKLARLRQEKLVSPEAAYYTERSRPPRGIWTAYPIVMRWASGYNPPSTPPHRPDDAVAAYWFDFYTPADARAGDNAARYRSSYVWLFVLATAAVMFGALSGIFHGRDEVMVPAMSGLELLTLAAIVALVIFAMRRDWHERSIEYRLLAELCRKQQVLAPLGRTVSLGAVRHMGAPDRAAWVAWLFAAYRRAAPLPRGDMTTLLGIRRKHVLEVLIDEQLKYHRDRGDMARSADKTFAGWGAGFFAAVWVCVLLELTATRLGWRAGWELFYGFLAIVLPAISAAVVGIRGYAELQLLAEQSHHMTDELKRAKARIKRLNLSRPMAAQDLGAETDAVATLMLQDLEGWARLFQVKPLETQ